MAGIAGDVIPEWFKHVKEPSVSYGGSLTSVAVPVLLMSPVSFLIPGDIACTATMGLLLLAVHSLYEKAY